MLRGERNTVLVRWPLAVAAFDRLFVARTAVELHILVALMASSTPCTMTTITRSVHLVLMTTVQTNPLKQILCIRDELFKQTLCSSLTLEGLSWNIAKDV
eukprot:1485408-Amphidinium_carterae.1